MLHKYRHILLYALSLGLLLVLLQFMEYRLIILDHAFELYITLIAILFTGLGIWLAIKLTRPKIETRIETVVVEKEVYRAPPNGQFVFNEAAMEKLGLSSRELEVLQGMAAGRSNHEIADQLFISLNTVKTHCARLFEKLDVKRRTQAVDKGRQLGLIA